MYLAALLVVVPERLVDLFASSRGQYRHPHAPQRLCLVEFLYARPARGTAG